MKKWIIIGGIATAFVVLLGGLSIFYVVGIANRATYKRQTQDLVVETFGAVKKTKSGGAERSLDAFEQLKKHAGDAIDKLEKRPAPRGAEELKADAVQLIDLANDVADRGIIFFTYIVKIEKIIEDWSAAINEVGKSANSTTKLKGFQSATTAASNGLNKLTPPGRLVAFHLKLTSLLNDMSAKLGEMIDAFNAKDAARLQAISGQWDNLSKQLDALSDSIGEDVANDVMTSAEQNKMKRLAKKIDNF